MQALRLTSTLFGKDIRMMWSLKDQYVKDHEDVRCMLTVVVRVRPVALPSACILSGWELDHASPMAEKCP